MFNGLSTQWFIEFFRTQKSAIPYICLTIPCKANKKKSSEDNNPLTLGVSPSYSTNEWFHFYFLLMSYLLPKI